MATTHYHCRTCECTDTVQQFSLGDQDYRCPNCGGFDVFPLRLFRCDGCGHTAEQTVFFGPDVSANDDPAELGLPRVCHRGFCKSQTYSQVSVRETNPGDPSKNLRRAPVPKKRTNVKGRRR